MLYPYLIHTFGIPDSYFSPGDTFFSIEGIFNWKKRGYPPLKRCKSLCKATITFSVLCMDSRLIFSASMQLCCKALDRPLQQMRISLRWFSISCLRLFIMTLSFKWYIIFLPCLIGVDIPLQPGRWKEARFFKDFFMPYRSIDFIKKILKNP